jgi:DNA replication protein DnaC
LARRALAQIGEHEVRLDTDPAYASRVDRTERERAEREAAEAREARLRFLAAAGVPERLWVPLLTGDLDDTAALAAVRSWLRYGCRPAFLVLAGGRGVGKTTAASWAISERGGRRVKGGEIATASDFDPGFMAPLERASLLVLDDLGAESLDAGGWAAGRFARLIDIRYERDAPTIIATNLTMPAFLARYGEDGGRLRDRLREAGRWVDIAGESLRRPGAAAGRAAP